MPETNLSVVLIGDSIRMGYQDTVRQELQDIAEVWMPDQNGGNSDNMLNHMDEWILDRTPDVVHLNCGLHDIKKEFGVAEAVIPVAAYEENLKQIFSKLRNHLSMSVIWATTTPVDEALHHENKTFDRFEQDVVAFNDVSCRLARTFDLLIHDLYSVMMDAGPARYLTPDGVHFSSDGSIILGRAVARYIRTSLRE